MEEAALARLRQMIPEARLDCGQLAACEKALAAGMPAGAEAADAFRAEYQTLAADAGQHCGEHFRGQGGGGRKPGRSPPEGAVSSSRPTGPRS